MAYADDIECLDWLNEVGLGQYEEAFCVNCSIGGALLSRNRLRQIRLKDFPKMNITNFEHQKLLLNHIDHTLNFSFHSPIRKREVNVKMGIPVEEPATIMFPPHVPPDGNKALAVKKNVSSRRRRSFDSAAWDSISKLRNAENAHKVAADHLRAIHSGVVDHIKSENKKVRRRRRSFDPDNSLKELSKTGNAIEYGNMAHVFDMIRAEMSEINAEVLQYFRDLMKCEEALIYFYDDKSRQLMFQYNGMWFRTGIDSGLASYCYRTGEVVNIEKCYDDHRFNRKIDEKTGLKSYNSLCQPVRSHNGGGSVVAVVQMLNKHEATVAGYGDENKTVDYVSFNSHDEDTLALCVQRVADDLGDRFAELLHVGDQFCGSAIHVPSGGPDMEPGESLFKAAKAKKIYEKGTFASRNYQIQTDEEFSAKLGAIDFQHSLDIGNPIEHKAEYAKYDF